MRAAAFALAAAAAIGPACADDAYTLPAVGAQLTYRQTIVTKMTDKAATITAGQVYVYTVTSVNGPVMEATIKPLALIYGCTPSDTSKDCAFASKAAGVTRDGNLLTIPVPGDVADVLAKSASLKSRYFVTEYRKYPMPGAKHPEDNPNDGTFGSEPEFVLTNELVCDPDRLKTFVPLGQTPHLSVPCHAIFSRTQARVGSTADQHADEAGTAELSYDGPGRVSLPSGEWDVTKIGLKFVPGDPSRPVPRTELSVAAKLGVPVRTHTIVEVPAAHVVTENTSELIAYKP